MAKLNSLASSMANLFKKVYNPPVDHISFGDVEDELPENGMSSENDPMNEWGSISGHRITAGISKLKKQSEEALTEEEDKKLRQKLQEYCTEYNLTLHPVFMTGNYVLKNAQGVETFNFKPSGSFTHNGYDLVGQHYKDMLIISAGQFKGNSKIVFPFVAEDDPKIPKELQEANLRLAIVTMLEEGIEIDRIKIKSKTWEHLVDEYRKDEVVNDVVNGSGVKAGEDYNKPESQAPPTAKEQFTSERKAKPQSNDLSGKQAEKLIDSLLDVNSLLNMDYTNQTKTVQIPDDFKAQSDEPVLNSEASKFSVEGEKARLEKELRWALETAGGNVSMLMNQNHSFAKRNYEIAFSLDGETVTITNDVPAKDGNIHNVILQTNDLNYGKLYREKAIEYAQDKKLIDKRMGGDVQIAVENILAESNGDYATFMKGIDKFSSRYRDVEGRDFGSVVTPDGKHYIVSTEVDYHRTETKVSLDNEIGRALVKSKAASENPTVKAESPAAKNQDRFDSMFEPSVHAAPKKEAAANEQEADKKKSAKFKI